MSEAVLAPPTGAVASGDWPRWRVVLIRVWAGALSALALILAQGIVRIGSAGADERFMYASSTVWKLLSLGGVAFVLWTGGRNVAAYWAIAVGQVTWIVAGIVSPQNDGNGVWLTLVNLVLFYGPLIVLRPRRRELLRPHFHVNLKLLGIALIASVPLIAYAARLPRYLDGELGFDMAGLYLILAAMALFAALQPRAGRFAGPIVGAAAVVTGVAAMVYPHDLASVGRVGGALLISGGLAFAALAWKEQRLRRHGGGAAGRGVAAAARVRNRR